MPYDNLDELRYRLEEIAPHLTRYGKLEANNYFSQAEQLFKSTPMNFEGKVDIKQKTLGDFFMTDAITRASPTMAKCVAAVKKQAQA